MLAASNIRPPIAGIGDAHARLLRPALGFNRPSDVLKDPDLHVSEKRAVLSSWASDACSVEGSPNLRWFIGSDGPVPLNEVMEALRRIERTRRAAKTESRRHPPRRR
jgi:tagatose-1,6-bisphosphate aldolase non-catalytic subunit AgaZ/GatZ